MFKCLHVIYILCNYKQNLNKCMFISNEYTCNVYIPKLSYVN